MRIRKWCNRLLTLGLLTALISSTITGTVAVFQEKSGCIRFDGVNDYVEVPDDISLQLVSAGTVEVWVRFNSFRDFTGVIGKADIMGWLDVDYGIVQRTAGRLTGTITDGSTSQHIIGVGLLSLNTWYHAVFTWDGSMLRLFLNNVMVNSISQTITPRVSADPIRIGVWGSPAASIDGFIDEARIYNRALDSLEVQYNAIHRLPYDTTGLVLWLRMNECVGDTAFDYSGHGNHGVLMNNPLWRWGSPFEAIIQ